MKKMLVTDMINFLQKLGEIQAGEIKIQKFEAAILDTLENEDDDESLTIYLIPNNSERVFMLVAGLPPQLFEFINTPRPLIITEISVPHVNRLFLYTKKVFILLEE